MWNDWEFVIKRSTPTIAQRDGRNPWNTLVKVSDFQTENRISNHPNTLHFLCIIFFSLEVYSVIHLKRQPGRKHSLFYLTARTLKHSSVYSNIVIKMLRVFMVTQCAEKALYTLVAGSTISDGICFKNLWKIMKTKPGWQVSRQRFEQGIPRER